MGKKVKKKARSGQKEKRGPPVSLKTSVLQGAKNVETPDDGIAGIKDRGLCSHTDRGINLDKLSAKLGSPQSLNCEDCRGNVDGRAKKGKGKQGKKGGVKSKSETSSIWVCLECGHFSCGGVGLPTTPQSHAVRHAKQNHHPLVVHYENHQLLWCFSCSKLISADKSGDSKHKEILNEIDKILKGQSAEGATVDAEDVWFGSGSVSSAIKSDYSSSIGADSNAAYSVRGLVNLGNTCFFNSIMQNLLAIDSFRDYFFQLDDSVGPLGASMRKLFLEISSETSSRSAINPRSLFGTLCMKSPQFRGYQQHDSHELLRCFLDGLSTEELSARKHTKSQDASIVGPTFVDSIFGGRLSSTVSCLECRYSSTIYEPFLDLSIPVPTKKPPVKKAQHVTRGKKSKFPPKKSGKNASKNSKVQGQSASVQSISGNSSNEVSTAPRADKLVLSWSDSGFPDSIDPSTIALDMGFTAEDLSVVQKPKNQQADQNIVEQSISSDSFAWLDYLDTDQVSPGTNVASEIDEISANPVFVNEDARQADASLSIDLNTRIRAVSTIVNVASASSLNDAKHLNSLLPVVSTEQVLCQVDDMKNVKPLCNDTVSTEHSVHEEARFDVDLGHSDSCKQDCSRDSSSSVQDNEQSSQTQEVKPQNNETLTAESSFIEDVQHGAELGSVFDSCKQVSSGDSYTLGRDIEPLSEIQDSEFGLLPSKEVALSSGEVLRTETETSAVILGDEQDSLGFDGFGDLFNEPETSVEHKSVAHPVSEGNDARSGNIGNSSESDPDEVDNADAPVSVESCLALFTKPELLSKDEHAWQCDNCTKVLRERRIREKRKAETPDSDVAPNGCEDGNSRALMDVNIFNNVTSTNGNLEKEDVSDDISLAKNRSHENGKCVLGKQPESGISVSSEPHMRNASSGSVEYTNSSNENLNPCHGEQHSNRHEPAESNLYSTKSEAEGSEHEEVDSENVKVKRDATKSILINKLPPILTIHLKRFTQDARGRLSKLNGHVKFREIIDLKPYVDPRCSDSENFIYHLAGVVEHLGSMRGGHYVAYVRGTKNLGNSIWYHASDVYVREASLEEVLRCEAYILFYERTSE